ncbi:hypothetical protein A3Q56_00076 [Intoshia linei]|uniref:Protein Wnt n=1 Tax=Intoshia linei TaxID=1819745 RepID=A0A177BD48_9BILA|nr:hypothetical protein A3Q56_00076 [Intoshia linei]
MNAQHLHFSAWIFIATLFSQAHLNSAIYAWMLRNYKLVHLKFSDFGAIYAGKIINELHPNDTQINYAYRNAEFSCYIDGLSTTQRRICQAYMDHMPSVADATKMALNTCQTVLFNRPWNCSIGSKGGTKRIYKRTLDSLESTIVEKNAFNSMDDSVNKESAFLHALSSAAVAWSISRACADGKLTNCNCGNKNDINSKMTNWIWNGCNDNTSYGYKFSSGFIDVKEKDRNYARYSMGLARALMNIHNNEAGRLLIRKSSAMKCRCHGVSGSCTLKTCTMKMQDFMDIGTTLREMYDQAQKVSFNKAGTTLRRIQDRKKPLKSELIFIENSPNYCSFIKDRKCTPYVYNELISKTHTQNTLERLSNPKEDDCDVVCCGRGYRLEKIKVEYSCNCHFKWCCNVTCQQCFKNITTGICK